MTPAEIRALPPAEKAKAVRKKLRKQGIHVPPKGAWRKRAGRAKTPEEIALSDEAAKLGAEWREAVNRKSIEDQEKLGWLDSPEISTGKPETCDDNHDMTCVESEDAEEVAEDAELTAKLVAMGIRVPPKYAYMKTFGLAKADPDFDEAMEIGAAWRAEMNRLPLEEPRTTDACHS